jgi:Arc/MetJ-type ribon-helix-helix transcriptional regulator
MAETSKNGFESAQVSNRRSKTLERTRCQIDIPGEFYRKIEARIAGSQFKSVEEYVLHVIREVMAAEKGGDDLLTEEQRARIENRLRDLGYFD